MIGEKENGSDISTSKEKERTPHSGSIIYLVSMSPCHLAVIAPVSSYRAHWLPSGLTPSEPSELGEIFITISGDLAGQ